MNSKKILRPLIAACLCVTGVMTSTTFADEKKEIEQIVKYRQAVMTILNRNMKIMGSMMKGYLPYDAPTFSRLAQDLDATAHLDVLSGFPKGTINDESDASNDIWLNIDDFEQKYKDLKVTAKEVSLAAESGDKDKIKPVFLELAKACKDCHKAYRK